MKDPFHSLPPDPPPHLKHLDLDRHLRSKIRIVTLGDSVTCSQDIFEKSWPALLEKKLKKALKHDSVSVANAGIGGTTSGQGLARWERDVVPCQPTLLIFSCILNDGHLQDGVKAGGFTDVFRKHTPQQALANWKRVVERAERELKADVLLWTANPWIPWWVAEGSPEWSYWQDRHYDETRRAWMEFAAQKNIPVVDTCAEFMKRRDLESLMKDWLHHNEIGAELIARCMADRIVSMLQEQ